MTDGIEIYTSSDLTPAQRELAEQSIVSTVEHARAEADAMRARSAEEAKLLAAITEPLSKLIQADPAAAAAAEKFSKRRAEGEDSLSPEGSPSVAHDLVIPMSPTDNAVDVRLPPYDYAWRWHDTGGDAPYSQMGDQRGRLGIDARAGGLMPGSGDRRVSAHIGVGCFVRLDRPTILTFFATRDVYYSFIVGSRGIGASATSEGHFEASFFKGDQRVMASTVGLWRRRVSGFEEARDRRDWTRNESGLMGGLFNPGDYAYNVGIWASADYSSGVGSAGVQTLFQSNILDMRIHRRLA